MGNSDYYSIGMVLVSLIAILNLANVAINIWSKTRRRPPIDVTLQDYVRRSEFNKLREDIDKLREEMRDNDRQIFDLLRKQQEELSDSRGRLTLSFCDWQRGIERQLGRMESHLGGNGHEA